MNIKDKVAEIIQTIEDDHKGDMFTDHSGYGMKDFAEVVENVMNQDSTNEFDVGFYQGAKFMGTELINYDNDQKKKIKDNSLSIALEIMTEDQVAEFIAKTEEDMSKEKSHSYQDMANLTHKTQVEEFNWCLCEEQEQFPYEDCPKESVGKLIKEEE